jgi:hypothetical protein
VRFTLVQVSAPTNVPVGQGEHRLRLRQDIQIKTGFPQASRFDFEGGMIDHAVCSRFARSDTTMSAPWSRRACA